MIYKKTIKLQYGVKIFNNVHQKKINEWLTYKNKDLMDFEVDKIVELQNNKLLFYYSYLSYPETEN